MCGIVAGWWDPQSFDERTAYAARLEQVFRNSARRGRDGYGMTWYNSMTSQAMIYKTMSDAGKLEAYERVREWQRGTTFAFATRAAPVTEGGVKLKNVHPHQSAKWLAVHNGIISNDWELRDAYDLNDHLKTDVDTEVVPWLRDVLSPVGLAQKLQGGFAMALLNAKDGILEIYRNYKILYMTALPGLFVVASESRTLEPIGGPVIPFPTHSVLGIDPLGSDPWLQFFEGDYVGHTPELNSNKAMVVISGGLDSSTVAYVAAKYWDMDVTLFHVDYDHKSAGMEQKACEDVATCLGVELITVRASWLGRLGHSPLTSEDIDVPLGRESSKTSLCWVPARNLVFLSMAAAYAEANGIEYIFYGSNLEEEGPAWKDNDQAAVEAFDQAFFFGTLRGVKLFNVFGRLMKRDIITLGTALGVPLHRTCSCDEPVKQQDEFGFYQGWLACGRCGCCHNRRHAYIQAGIDDPQEYAFDMIHTYPSVEAVGDTDLDNIVERLRGPSEYWDEQYAVNQNPLRLFDVARRSLGNVG